MTEGEFLATLEEIGWLDAVPPRGAPRGFAPRWRVRSLADPRYAFYALAVTGFDPECIEGSGADEPCSYHSVITQLAEASYGTFAPVDLRDELDKDRGRGAGLVPTWGQGLRVRGPVGWRLVPAPGPRPGGPGDRGGQDRGPGHPAAAVQSDDFLGVGAPRPV